MTTQEAIRLLRTEQLGDSERLELAKQMGADALERKHIHFVIPKCEACGQYIPGVTIHTLHSGKIGIIIAVSEIDPAHCPACHALFIGADLDYEEQTCILRVLKEAPTE